MFGVLYCALQNPTQDAQPDVHDLRGYGGGAAHVMRDDGDVRKWAGVVLLIPRRPVRNGADRLPSAESHKPPDCQLLLCGVLPRGGLLGGMRRQHKGKLARSSCLGLVGA